MNNSDRSSIPLWAVLYPANIAAALASGAFGVIAFGDPSALIAAPVAPDATTGFFVDMYALRAVVIAAGLIAASLVMRRAPLVASAVLAAGGVVQLGDAVIASQWGTPGVIGAGIAATVHLASAVLLALRARSQQVRSPAKRSQQDAGPTPAPGGH